MGLLSASSVPHVASWEQLSAHYRKPLSPLAMKKHTKFLVLGILTNGREIRKWRNLPTPIASVMTGKVKDRVKDRRISVHSASGNRRGAEMNTE